MNSTQRRAQIVRDLQNATEAINATALAGRFSVTRQIIVADIALLRAAGHRIRAEHRGYRLEKADPSRLVKNIVCCHTKEHVCDEFYAIVDNGGQVQNVVVEHSIYGRISADLCIASRYDADEFVRRVSQAGASQLADLTGGIHTHAISVRSEQEFDRICHRLTELGILLERD